MSTDESPMDAIMEDFEEACSIDDSHLNYGFYRVMQMQLADLNFQKKNYLETAYHLTECHGILMRHYGLVNFGHAQRDVLPEPKLKWEDISTQSTYAKDKAAGMVRRLRELPEEWTVVQLTRRTPWPPTNGPNSSPKLESFFLTRLPCGSQIDKFTPFTGYFECPKGSTDLLDIMWDVVKKLAFKTADNAKTCKLRVKASYKLKNLIPELGDAYFHEWQTCFLGRLLDFELEESIRARLDRIVSKSNTKLNKKDLYLLYLIAEGCHYVKGDHIENAIHFLFPDDSETEQLLIQEFKKLVNMEGLKAAKRHPVLLIVDELLDVIPWERMNVLEDHPVSRIPSLHILHALHNSHKPYIRKGLREVYDDEISYFIVNPEGNLPSVEETLKKFFSARLLKWDGVIGEKPSKEQIVKALTMANSYLYCGHGSGKQFMTQLNISKLHIKSVQLLFGCASGALEYVGGNTPPHGDILSYILGGSGCSIGMLYVVTSSDADNMAISIANIWLPGDPVDLSDIIHLRKEAKETVKLKLEREPELLRCLKVARMCCTNFFSGSGMIARGLPVKLVPRKP